jgi:hypothetical protein
MAASARVGALITTAWRAGAGAASLARTALFSPSALRSSLADLPATGSSARAYATDKPGGAGSAAGAEADTAAGSSVADASEASASVPELLEQVKQKEEHATKLAQQVQRYVWAWTCMHTWPAAELTATPQLRLRRH